MKIQRICYLFILLVTFLFPMVISAESEEVTAKIAVISLSDGRGEALNYYLVPEDERNPMPEQNVMKLDRDKGYFKISYHIPGDYYYRLYQEKGKRPDIDYDKTEYRVAVRILASENGKLEAEIWASNPDTREKTMIRFENKAKHLPEKDETETKPSRESSEPKVLGIEPGEMTAFYGLFVILCGTVIILLVFIVKKRKKEYKKGGKREYYEEE